MNFVCDCLEYLNCSCRSAINLRSGPPPPPPQQKKTGEAKEGKEKEAWSKEKIRNGERKDKPVGCSVESVSCDNQIDHNTIAGNCYDGWEPAKNWIPQR